MKAIFIMASKYNNILKNISFLIIASFLILYNTKALAENPDFFKVTIKSQKGVNEAKKYLGNDVWRADSCKGDNFQHFQFNNSPNVEVGNGKLGDGEKVKLLRAEKINNLIEVETSVCAPIGCNKTFEQYKILDKNKVLEWHFEGRLPNEGGHVLVDNGHDNFKNPARTFYRCKL